jgi:hypothetical protein
MEPDYAALGRKYGFSREAVETLAFAISRGGGKLAQFNHPELGGMGQWMPGMVMVGDMFNHSLKARVEALCVELSRIMPVASGFAPFAEFASYKAWWPEHLGRSSATGDQNDLAYAYFPQKNRLALNLSGKIYLYDTTGHTITGLSQQQSGFTRSILLHTPQGLLDLSNLPPVKD